MIFGVGTDIVAIKRMTELWQRHGEHALRKILAPDERAACTASQDPARVLAKRFVAKEALGKALGIGIRFPLVLPEISVTHDALGKPGFSFSPSLAAYFSQRKMTAHLSISDEQDYAVAFVLLETP
ncbi:4'-phosphopantetheinyl transferase [Rugosibacter aromaticivorans]|uniref:Holo-[acyl-carrier-protein] synthase n=1 Tax=Rugosibacter aromaticivorans TaxID=1565605 RepID=A0A0C5JLS9_9PROT|nr:holo-ACP synthase [Rugosibacter aromaticivorans]AJP48361.1 4'-phosphopantetheinyl transferase [Rugosibacter aromaticivorans]TBR13784.1 MAG: holo-ACP synthase [Rugosibacter sp.]